jgi:hypothetical protein
LLRRKQHAGTGRRGRRAGHGVTSLSRKTANGKQQPSKKKAKQQTARNGKKAYARLPFRLLPFACCLRFAVCCFILRGSCVARTPPYLGGRPPVMSDSASAPGEILLGDQFLLTWTATPNRNRAYAYVKDMDAVRAEITSLMMTKPRAR